MDEMIEFLIDRIFQFDLMIHFYKPSIKILQRLVKTKMRKEFYNESLNFYKLFK